MKKIFVIGVALFSLLPLSGCFKTRAEIAKEKEGKEIQEQKLTELRATIVGEHVIKALKQY